MIKITFYFTTEINECDSQPCKNGGKCVEGGIGSGDGSGLNAVGLTNEEPTYSCVCEAGYEGKRCEKGTANFIGTRYQLIYSQLFFYNNNLLKQSSLHRIVIIIILIMITIPTI